MKGCAKFLLYVAVNKFIRKNIQQKLVHIHNSQNNQNFFWSFSNLYSNLIWSFWVASRRKIKIWIRGKKSSVYYWKLHFQGRHACKLPFLVINWTFFPQTQIFCAGSCGYAPATANIQVIFNYVKVKEERKNEITTFLTLTWIVVIL